VGVRQVKAKVQPSCQRAPTSPARLPAQGMRPQVSAEALEPAVLPGAGVPAGSPSLAGGAAASPASPGCRGPSPTCAGGACAPSAGEACAPSGPGDGRYGGAWSRSRSFFSLPLCDRPGCHEPPAISLRNPACYCSLACRQAVRNVQDRERKWCSRGTLEGQKKRAYEYEAARRRSARRPDGTSAAVSSRAPPG